MKTMMKRFPLVSKIVLALALIAIAPTSAWAVGEVNGRIGGVVTEAQTGAPVPGATVTVSGKSLPGGARTVTTADDGRYEIVELPPGRYDVEVSYSGVKPLKRRVVVRQGELLPLDIAWSAELAEAEVTVVVEERHMTKPDTTQTGTVVSADTSAKVATNRSYQDIALQVAGTVDAGNAPGNPSVKGGNALGNRWLIDGLDVSDAVLGTFSANLNFDSIASVEVITGGMEAQYNSLGGVINLITAGGSDEWHVNASLYVNNAKFSAQGQYGSQLYQGEQPYFRVTQAPTQSYQAVLNVSGPIVKHRLWFNVGIEYNYTESSTPAGPPLNLVPPTRRFNGVNARLKLTYAPNEKHRLTLSIAADPAFISNIRRASALFRLPSAQTYQSQGGVIAVAQWDYFINQKMNFQLQTGFQFSELDNGSMGWFKDRPGGGVDQIPVDRRMDFSDKALGYDRANAQHINQDDRTIWYQGESATTYDRRYTFQFDPSISLRGKAAGTHDAKIGIQTRYVASTYDVEQTGGGVSYTDRGGGPGEAGLCDEATGSGGCFLKTVSDNYRQKYEGYSLGLYLQDRWRPHKRILILPGIRFDFGQTWNAAKELATSLFGVGPRLGFNVDLTGDQKTILSAFYGRANEVLNLLPAAYGSPSAYSQTFAWTGTAFDQVVAASGGTKGYRFDPNATAPHTDEVTVSLRRELFKDSVGGVDYTWKRVSNMWTWMEVNQIWDPTGTRTIGYVDNNNPQQIRLITTPSTNYREYQGVDFYVESRPSPNWDIYLAYTLSFLYGPGAEQFEGQVFTGLRGPYYNPRQTMFYQGFLPEDVRHQLRIRAAYNYKGFNIGSYLNYITGTPTSKLFFVYSPDGDYINLRSPLGTDPATPNNARNFAELRNPDLLIIDTRVSYDFHALIKQHLVLIVDMFNMLNVRQPTGFQSVDVPQFGQVTGRVQPFRFQLGLRYDY
jgi:hypothetical protein